MAKRTQPPMFEPRTGSEQPLLIYCNHALVAMTVWDITIDIGQAQLREVREREDGQTVIPVDFKARIVMSPQHAKAFSQALAQNLRQYENDFGEIKLQPKQQGQ
jgi:hypothetical protein